MSTLRSAQDALELVSRLRTSFETGFTRSRDWRTTQLRALRRMIIEHEQDIEAALMADLGKPAVEAQITEIGFVLGEIDHTLTHLARWMKPQRVRVPAALVPASARVVSEPLGVALIIAPWNYPFQLAIAPLIGALAAGCAVVVKPSEISGATSNLLARLVAEYLDPRACAVVEGAAAETRWLLEARWDHILYTGNERVARVIAEAAAKHLTPTTLELGGKSPTFVDETTDMRAAATRIVWGKFVNAGQTCVAPDYVLVTPVARPLLERALTDAVEAMFGSDPEVSPSYARIINDTHFDRLTALLGTGRSLLGGKLDKKSRYFPPTILADESAGSPVMRDEIFGPILPMIEVATHVDAIAFINARPKPLALYVFSETARVRRDFTEQTSSGALGFNVPLAHMSVHDLPFGGVGMSGSGAYHGKRSFEIFSHAKAVLSKPLRPETLGVIFPPYSRRKASLVTGALRKLS
ncbi:MAG: aldehyde dehydrogenase family protein [Microbacteriaceae bacterium]|nr:aldehyde dehydrogenase family protein [Microbacteriaceae bacterium]